MNRTRVRDDGADGIAHMDCEIAPLRYTDLGVTSQSHYGVGGDLKIEFEGYTHPERFVVADGDV